MNHNWELRNGIKLVVIIGLLVWFVCIHAWILVAILTAGTVAGYAITVSNLRNRRPGESIDELIARDDLTTNTGPRCQCLGARNPRCAAAKHHTYLVLSCDHHVHYLLANPPRTGETAWCPGHRRFGPAQPFRVVEVESLLSVKPLFGIGRTPIPDGRAVVRRPR